MTYNPKPPFTGTRELELDGARATYGYFTAARTWDDTIVVYENGSAYLGSLASATLAALVDRFDHDSGYWPDGHIGAFAVVAATSAEAETSARMLHRHVQEEWHSSTIRVSPDCEAWPGPDANALVFRLLARPDAGAASACGYFFASL